MTNETPDYLTLKARKAKSGFGKEKKRLLEEFRSANFSVTHYCIHDPEGKLEEAKKERAEVAHRIEEITHSNE